MAVKKTKTFKDVADVTTAGSNQRVVLTDENGGVTKIKVEDFLKNALDKQKASLLETNVFIVFHDKEQKYARAVVPSQWKTYEQQGQFADGVMIVEGGKHVVVAATESAEALPWSTENIAGGGFTSTDRIAAFNDWNGESNAKKQLEKVQCQPSTVAVGYCSKYERGNVLIAGKWWLPSVGELEMIYANKLKINYALSLINGAMPLSESWYWSSTESSATLAWNLSFANGYLGNYYGTKATDKLRVRAVSAFY